MCRLRDSHRLIVFLTQNQQSVSPTGEWTLFRKVFLFQKVSCDLDFLKVSIFKIWYVRNFCLKNKSKRVKWLSALLWVSRTILRSPEYRSYSVWSANKHGEHFHKLRARGGPNNRSIMLLFFNFHYIFSSICMEIKHNRKIFCPAKSAHYLAQSY